MIATSRSQSSGLKQLQERYPETLEVETVDVVDLRSVKALHSRLEGRKLDVLFVNAGICKANELTPIEVEEIGFVDMMVTNALSPMRIIEVIHDSVVENGVIAVMSSEIGSIGSCVGFWELYSCSAEYADGGVRCAQ